MPTTTTTLSPVSVTAKRVDDNELTLRLKGVKFGGWMEVRVTRGIDRCPNDFEIQLTERYPDKPTATVVMPGDACEVLLGNDVVLTGYVDRFIPEIDAYQHRVTIMGRGKCQDLVDCSAISPNCYIVSDSVLRIAQMLGKPYGITATVVEGQDSGRPIQDIAYTLGETAFSIIETACRHRALLAYEKPDGNLQLSRVSDRRAGSGFAEGINVIRARAMFSMDQRYSEITSFLVGADVYGDLGTGGNLLTPVKDEQVTRFRNRFVQAEGPPGTDDSQRTLRAIWERNRRYGRGYVVQLTTDSWRDMNGDLYEPNTRVRVNLPSLKLYDVDWLIAEVSYRRGVEGTTCDLIIMPPDAFDVQPPVWLKWNDVQGPGVTR